MPKSVGRINQNGVSLFSPDEGGAIEWESPERDRNHASAEDPATRDKV